MRENGVSVLGPFGLFYADHHAGAVDVRDLEIGNFANAQTGSIGSHQKHPVSWRVSAGKEPVDLLAAEQYRELSRFLASRYREIDTVPTHHFEIEEAESRDDHIATAPGQAALDCEV